MESFDSCCSPSPSASSGCSGGVRPPGCPRAPSASASESLAMSSEASSRCTALAKPRWSSIAPSSLSSSAPALSSIACAPEFDDAPRAGRRLQARSAARAPSWRRRPPAAPRRGRAPRPPGSCDSGRRASRSGSTRRPPCAASRSPRPAPARRRRTARAPPGSAARGGDGSRRCGRRAAATSNRRCRAGSRPRADSACAAAPAGAPWRRPGRRPAPGLSAEKATSSSGWRDIARAHDGERALERLVGGFGLSAPGLRLRGLDVDGGHSRVLSESQSGKSGAAVISFRDIGRAGRRPQGAATRSRSGLAGRLRNAPLIAD